LRAAESSGRPLGTDVFVTRLERIGERKLRPPKPDRKARAPRQPKDLFGNLTQSR
jgi:hypothetical protein